MEEACSTDEMRPARGGSTESTPLYGGSKASPQMSQMDTGLMIMLPFVGIVLGLAPAVACLYIYYSNGGEGAQCSRPIGTWLCWQGYVV